MKISSGRDIEIDVGGDLVGGDKKEASSSLSFSVIIEKLILYVKLALQALTNWL